MCVYKYICLVYKYIYGKNTYSNRRVANHLHGLIFELKERMNSRQDRPVMQHVIYNEIYLLLYKSIKQSRHYANVIYCIYIKILCAVYIDHNIYAI